MRAMAPSMASSSRCLSAPAPSPVAGDAPAASSSNTIAPPAPGPTAARTGSPLHGSSSPPTVQLQLQTSVFVSFSCPPHARPPPRSPPHAGLLPVGRPDQEQLISQSQHDGGHRFDYVEGFVVAVEGLINNWRSSFFSLQNPIPRQGSLGQQQQQADVYLKASSQRKLAAANAIIKLQWCLVEVLFI
ncbi:Cytokinin dehydrogenase 5 [Hordeum vulgare]|nr:Cytokinin dehydrogenase 5 [Hordeum vulgare]